MGDVNHSLRKRKKLHNQLLICPALCFLFWLHLPKYWYKLTARKKKKVSEAEVECAWPCHGMKVVEEQGDRQNARGEVKLPGNVWLSLHSCWERAVQKGWHWMFLHVLLWRRTPCRRAPRHLNQVNAKHRPRRKHLCSPWLLSCLVKSTEYGNLLAHTGGRGGNVDQVD